jgi:hypothetical protein
VEVKKNEDRSQLLASEKIKNEKEKLRKFFASLSMEKQNEIDAMAVAIAKKERPNLTDHFLRAYAVAHKSRLIRDEYIQSI